MLSQFLLKNFYSVLHLAFCSLNEERGIHSLWAPICFVKVETLSLSCFHRVLENVRPTDNYTTNFQMGHFIFVMQN